MRITPMEDADAGEDRMLLLDGYTEAETKHIFALAAKWRSWELLQALQAQAAVDAHFAGCNAGCDADLQGGVWHCRQWQELHTEARLLREAVLAQIGEAK